MAQNNAIPAISSMRRRSPANTEATQTVSFIPYLPAFLVAVLQDFLDLVFLIMMSSTVLAPIAIVLAFIFDIGLGAITATWLFLFTSSKAPFMKRWKRFFFPEAANIIPIVSILPMACLSVWLVYRLDKSAASIANKTVGRW